MLRLLHLLVWLVSTSIGKHPPDVMTEGDFIDGDLFYKVDDSADRTQAQALDFCKLSGGQLATLTGIRLYNILQAAVPSIGGYWLDGVSSMNQFDLINDCTYDPLRLDEIPEDNLELTPLTCLSFNKGADTTTTKIKLVNCNDVMKGVVCSIPLNGCWMNSTTTQGTIDTSTQDTSTQDTSTQDTSTQDTTSASPSPTP